MPALRLFSPAEAAAVSGVGLKAIHNAIDKRVVMGAETPSDARGQQARRLTGSDLVRLKLWFGIGSLLSSERRLQLFKEIDARPSADKIRAGDLLIVDVGKARRQIALRTRALEEAEAAIVSVKGVMAGEAVFDGTRIPVRLVTAPMSTC